MPTKINRTKISKHRASRPKTQKKITYRLESVPNRYGFGRDYTLIIGNKRYWLGQDAKVFARILGMDMGYGVDYYTKKANSKDFDKLAPHIAGDLIRTFLGKEADSPITQEDLKKLTKAQAWDLASE